MQTTSRTPASADFTIASAANAGGTRNDTSSSAPDIFHTISNGIKNRFIQMFLSPPRPVTCPTHHIRCPYSIILRGVKDVPFAAGKNPELGLLEFLLTRMLIAYLFDKSAKIGDLIF